MNPSAMRLAKKFQIDVAVAEALVAAGYNCPRKLRDAKESDLTMVEGVAESGLIARLARKKVKA